MAENNQKNENISKIKGDSNYVWQGFKGTSKSEIEGNKNITIQGVDSANVPEKVNWWTKAGVIATIIGAIVAVLTFLITCNI